MASDNFRVPRVHARAQPPRFPHRRAPPRIPLQRAAAARSTRNLQALGLTLEPRRQSFGPCDVVDSDCGFDSICFDSPNGRLSEPDLLQPSSGALRDRDWPPLVPGGELDAAERRVGRACPRSAPPAPPRRAISRTRSSLPEVRVEVRLPDLGRGGDAELHGGLTQRGHHLPSRHSHLAGPQLDQELIQQDVEGGKPRRLLVDRRSCRPDRGARGQA